jgi:hypothetical protein
MKYIKVDLKKFNIVMHMLKCTNVTKSSLRSISEILQEGVSNDDENELTNPSGRLIKRLAPVIDLIADIEDSKEVYKEKYGKDRYNDITEFASQIKALINKLV